MLQNNWWGSNTSPATLISGTVAYDPWIILSINADPTTINTGSTSQITADLTHNSDNQDTSSQGYVPDGIPVQFNATLGNINNSGTTVNGRATATFQAGNNAGAANIQAKVDNQTVNTTITIGNLNSPPVLDPIGDKTVNEGQQLQFTVSGSDPDGDSLTYSAIGLPTGATFNNGIFDWTPNYTQSGIYNIQFTANDGTTNQHTHHSKNNRKQCEQTTIYEHNP